MSIISVAPMMDWTDRHFRYLLRLIAPDIMLYTEMITAQALKYGNVEKLLSYHSFEQPLVLQLGGSDPELLSHAAKLGESFAYHAINLNVGCPSPRVSAGRFGACLMLEPQLVADCVQAMTEAVNISVTVKCRIGVDEVDSYESLQHFISTVAHAGVDTFIIHARKAWLNGLSPKENREIPPLQYEVVYRIKKDFPTLNIILNGGLREIKDIERVLPHVDGVMIGRAAYQQPYSLAAIQEKYLPNKKIFSREEIVRQMLPYIESQLQMGTKLSTITRHLLNLFHGQPGGALWRRYLSEHAHRPFSGINTLEQALTLTKRG